MGYIGIWIPNTIQKGEDKRYKNILISLPKEDNKGGGYCLTQCFVFSERIHFLFAFKVQSQYFSEVEKAHILVLGSLPFGFWCR